MSEIENHTIPESADLRITLPEQNFDGPFHLLWQMIKDHKLDISNLPLIFVADTYMKYIEEMRKLDVNIASEFLVMASELLRMKSQALLPVEDRHEEEGEEDDGEDPRERLVRRLLIYQKYKKAAQKIGEFPLLGYKVFARPITAIAADINYSLEAPNSEIDGFSLIETLAKMLKKKKSQIEYHVFTERISIADKISDLVDYFHENEMALFYELVKKQKSSQEIITTFLALLEMVKLKMVKIHQAEVGGEIYISLVSRECLLNPVYRENGFDYR